MQQAMEEIRAILDSYGLATYVELFDEVLRYYVAGEEVQFREALLSNSVWGGAGSVCDVHLPSLHQEGGDGWQDQKSLDLAIVRLAEALDSRGLADERVRNWANAFRTWRDDGVYEHPPGSA
jgi:hypothetical protein